ncbi:MAG: hypothetical protein GY861_17115 [bacterium]|nr:hypothetical protein [bacterium]
MTEQECEGCGEDKEEVFKCRKVCLCQECIDNITTADNSIMWNRLEAQSKEILEHEENVQKEMLKRMQRGEKVTVKLALEAQKKEITKGLFFTSRCKCCNNNAKHLNGVGK